MDLECRATTQEISCSKLMTPTKLVIGLLIWAALEMWHISGTACVKSSSCGGWDLFIHSIVSIAIIAPVYLILYALGKREKRDAT